MPMIRNSRQLGLSMAILTGLCWAVVAIALKFALSFTDVFTIVWFRLAFSFLFLAMFMAWKGPENLAILRRPPLLVWLAGLGLAANYYGFMKGVELTSPNYAQVFIQLAPVLLICVGIFYFKERLTRGQLAGLGVAAFGFALFYQDRMGSAGAETGRLVQGNFWIVTAALSWVAYAAAHKVLMGKWSPQQINLVVYMIATAVFTPMVSWGDMAGFSPAVWLLMLFLGLNTVVAYGALGVALQKIPATEVSIIITLNPLLTLLLMALLGALEVTWIAPDPMHPLGYFAAAVVVAGVILALRKPAAKPRGAASSAST